MRDLDVVESNQLIYYPTKKKKGKVEGRTHMLPSESL